MTIRPDRNELKRRKREMLAVASEAFIEQVAQLAKERGCSLGELADRAQVDPIWFDYLQNRPQALSINWCLEFAIALGLQLKIILEAE